MVRRREPSNDSESFDPYEASRKELNRYFRRQKREQTISRFWLLCFFVLWVPFFWFLFFWDFSHLIAVSTVLQAVAVLLAFVPFLVPWVVDKYLPALRDAIENSVAGPRDDDVE